jgi:hypothetical protein
MPPAGPLLTELGILDRVPHGPVLWVPPLQASAWPPIATVASPDRMTAGTLRNPIAEFPRKL